jgi:GT2 family glycosyltransferase
MATRITVIIPSWQRRELVTKLLEHLRSQTRLPDEVMVVDDGSTDGTAEAAAAAGARVVRLTENRGFAVAVNAGLKATQSELVAVLNNDAIPEAKWLEELEKAIGEGVWFAAPKLLMADGTKLEGSFDLLCRSACAWRAGHGMTEAEFPATARGIHSAPWTAVLFRRELFQRVGYLDESFESYLEDVEFGLRCALPGLEGRYVPQAVVRHQGSATLGDWHPRKVRLMARNQLLLIARHYPAGWWRTEGWAVLVGQGLWGLVALRHGCGLAWLRGKAEGLRELLGMQRTGTPDTLQIVRDGEKLVRELLTQRGEKPAKNAYWRRYFSLT